MINQQQIRAKVWNNPCYFIAFGFGSGLMPKASGTWGTIIAIPLYLMIRDCSMYLYFLVTLIALIGGIWICEKVSKEMGVHDYSGIVWDEIVGYFITMIMAPKGVSWMLLGFLLFRIFDIWKPQPIRYVDKKITGGLGIMLDDVIAAVPAWIILQFLAWSLR